MSITIGTVVINRNPEHSTDFGKTKESQLSNELEDGSNDVYGSGITIIRGTIIVKYVKKEEAEALRDYITTKANFTTNSFQIVPPSFIDLGLGDGVTLENAYYTGGPDSRDFMKKAGFLGRYDIEFPYKITLPIDTAIVDTNGVIAI